MKNENPKRSGLRMLITKEGVYKVTTAYYGFGKDDFAPSFYDNPSSIENGKSYWRDGKFDSDSVDNFKGHKARIETR